MSALQLATIDLGNAEHTDRLVELLDHYARDPMGGGHALAPAARARLIAELRRVPGYHGALAWHEGEAVGLINCFTGFSTFAARPLLNIHDIVVRSDRRGRGIGRALLEWAQDTARALDCCKLTLEVLSNNHPALRAYRAAGFVPYELDPAAGQAILMQKPLA